MFYTRPITCINTYTLRGTALYCVLFSLWVLSHALALPGTLYTPGARHNARISVRKLQRSIITIYTYIQVYCSTMFTFLVPTLYSETSDFTYSMCFQMSKRIPASESPADKPVPVPGKARSA